MDHTVKLDDDQIARLLDLLGTYHDDVYNGSVSGYGQSKDDELIDVAVLMSTLRDAK